MNARQECFCLAYIEHANATKSAIEAGYSPATAYSIGQRLLKNVEIQKFINEYAETAAEKKKANADAVLVYLSEVMLDDNAPIGARLKAAELLGKRYGLWKGETEHAESNAVTVNINFQDCGKQNHDE